MNSSARRALILGLHLCAGAALFACGGDDSKASGNGGNGNQADGGGGGGGGGGGDGTLVLKTSPLYSAYVPSHEATLPITLKDSSLRTMGAQFTSSDPSIATVANTATGGLITIKKDGIVTIKVSLGGDTGAAKLTITKFTDEQWMTGQARYSKSELALTNPNGGAISALLLQDPNNRDPNGACNTCHTQQAKTLKIENGPTQIEGYSDSDLITIFTMGKKPDGAAQSTMVPAFAWGMFHEWQVTDDEKQGLIAYLRTQTPTDNPAMVDYGIQPCPGADIKGPYCDADGNPIMFVGPDAGTSGGGTDAGVAHDAGSSSDSGSGDAG